MKISQNVYRFRHRRLANPIACGIAAWGCWLAGVIATAQPHVPDQASPDEVQPADHEALPLPDRLIAWHIIGGTSKNVQTRHVGWGLPQSNWHSYVRLLVRPQLDAGVRRILLHNPFGRADLKLPMAFDQYLEAQESGDTWLTHHFVEAWSPVIAGQYTDGEPVEVICYLGSIDTDAQMKALVDTPEAWRDRARRSVEPALRAGMSVGFDSANDYAEDSLDFRLIKEIADAGTPVYIEPRPDAARPHLFDLNVISTDQHWFRSDPDKFKGAAHKATNQQLTGEIIILVKGIGDTPERQRRTRELLTDTHYSVAAVLNRQVNRTHDIADWAGLDQATTPSSSVSPPQPQATP